ncbi:MAG: hypothetical protein OJF59_002129 [Cytophagales bacterium]|nr:MAG: hypothetical protein OJF59_002129 [Cytophagales bacterium]
MNFNFKFETILSARYSFVATQKNVITINRPSSIKNRLLTDEDH